jgi:hypothetical protein
MNASQRSTEREMYVSAKETAFSQNPLREKDVKRAPEESKTLIAQIARIALRLRLLIRFHRPLSNQPKSGLAGSTMIQPIQSAFSVESESIAGARGGSLNSKLANHSATSLCPK